MALLVVAVLILAVSGHSSASWCVCKGGISDTVLQKALDWACGNGADCNPIKQNGVCYQPNTVHDHCSYAVNSYFQKKGQTTDACNFAGAAMLSSTNPSVNGCSFPSSSTSTTPTTSPATTTTPTTSTPITTTPTTSGTPTTTTTGTTTGSPYTATPTGILGAGSATGVGPSGMNTDMSHGGLHLLGSNNFLSVLFLVAVSVLALMPRLLY